MPKGVYLRKKNTYESFTEYIDNLSREYYIDFRGASLTMWKTPHRIIHMNLRTQKMKCCNTLNESKPLSYKEIKLISRIFYKSKNLF